MKILIWTSVLFSISFAVQLLVWRVKIPKRQTKVLLQVFFITLSAGLIALWVISYFMPGFSKYVPAHFTEYIHTFIFFISLLLSYMITYSAIEVDSPSLVMVMAIAKTGAKGLPKDEFERTMNDDLLVIPRIKDLVNDKMAYVKNGRYKLTTKGLFLAGLFVFYRRLLNAPKGG